MPVPERNINRAMLPGKGFILLFFLGMTLSLFSQQYNFRIFNTEDGLAQSYVYSIIQDDQGYLWAGTGNGLSRYNGFQIENYSTNDSLSDNFITGALHDGKLLWFGHMNGSLTCFDGRMYFTVTLPGSDGSPVTHMTKNQSGEIWVSSYSGALWKLDNPASIMPPYTFTDPVNITAFNFLDNDELIIGTPAGLMHCKIKEPGNIEVVSPFAEVPETRITCIQKMRSGKGFYITTQDDSIFILQSGTDRFRVSPMKLDPGSQLTGIQYIYEDSRSNIWLATFGSGLVRFRPDSSGRTRKVETLDKEHGFPADNVKTIFEDREGNIWCGSFGEGLIQITFKTFSVLKLDKPSSGSAVFSVFINRQYLWMGTTNGLIKTDQSTGTIIRVYGEDSGLPKDTITAIYSGNEEELWIGTDKHGVFRMNTRKERIVRYQHGFGDLENSITAITGNGEQVWIGTRKGLCAINLPAAQTTWYTISQGGLPHNFVHGLYLDNSGKLWVSTHSSILCYLQDGQIHKIPVNTEVGSLILGPITEDAGSRVWIGSNGNGIFKIGSDSIVSITTDNGLLSNYCYSIIGDDKKNIWVGHKDGLSRIRTANFSVKFFQHFEETKESYQFNANAICKDQTGKIWFGTNRGLVIYDPFMESPRYMPPVLGIVSLKVNDIERDVADILVLPPGIYKISIGYLGVSLKEPELVTYHYKLVGYDQEFEVTKDNSITYSHLTEGQYKFIIHATSGDGAVTEVPAILNIIIKKPVWKKWWFYLIIFIALSAFVFGYIKRREYMFRLEKAELEGKVQERTLEIQKQKNEIELQRDMIRKKNDNITSSIVYASQIQNAVLPPIEFIDRLFPDSFIFNKPKDIVSGDFYWFAEKGDKIIMTLADCTGHGVPGAFMSLLGITFLNEIVNAEGVTQSDAIVTSLRNKVRHALRQSRKDSSTNDGIDLVLCVFDQKLKRIQYTGAMNDLVFIRDGELKVIAADHLSVSALTEGSGVFTMKEIDVRKGDTFYMFSDGFQDQFGGDRNKKYLKHRFLEKLLEIHTLPMLKQKEILEMHLSEWMKDNVQTDDISVMGIRF